MKKIAGIVLLITGVISSIVGAITLIEITNAAAHISIIGGADGPTAIFLAGRLGLPVYGPMIAGVVLIIIGIILIVRRKDKE